MKRALLLKRASCLAVASVLAIGTSCTPQGTIEIGPVRVTQAIGESTILQSIFLPKDGAPIVWSDDFCDMPSEQELQDEVLNVGGIDLSGFVRLSALNLINAHLVATSGDFNFMTSITVRFIPKPSAGDPVVLGTASNAGGLGTEITLTPPEPVDFLELIRANDESDSLICPKLEYTVSYSGPPTSDVAYRAEVTVDGYVEVGQV
ncbi:MAG: hypothetical protein K1Y02_14550 [Candidatus Hydrogenedentes bacterium]|nr:hypothetical protein [Candidatus Hydrogenedentota bacterium]